MTSINPTLELVINRVVLASPEPKTCVSGQQLGPKTCVSGQQMAKNRRAIISYKEMSMCSYIISQIHFIIDIALVNVMVPNPQVTSKILK